MNKNKGQLFVIAAASGVGKTTLVNKILQHIEGLKLSISYTSRERRSKEIDGVHYNFISRTKFEEMVKKGDFIEYANVYGNLYGTSQQWLCEALAAGHDIILELDWQGNKQIRQIYPNAVSVFILPPSLDDLRSRLEKRAQDDEGIIATRLEKARHDISHYIDFDYLVVNDQVDNALEEIAAIIIATRLKRERQEVKLAGMLKTLLD